MSESQNQGNQIAEENQDPADVHDRNEGSDDMRFLETSDQGSVDDQYSEMSQEVEDDIQSERPVLFPGDYRDIGIGIDQPLPENGPQEPEATRPNLVNANTIPHPQQNYFENILQDQQEFLRSLDQADNQLMLDESFIQLVSDICNKNSHKMFKLDHRDPNVESKNNSVWTFSHISRGDRQLVPSTTSEDHRDLRERFEFLQQGDFRGIV